MCSRRLLCELCLDFCGDRVAALATLAEVPELKESLLPNLAVVRFEFCRRYDGYLDNPRVLQWNQDGIHAFDSCGREITEVVIIYNRSS